MSSYTCSYCQTGVMNTAEQYDKHISGTKHKKKAFALQAPFGGIEYEEFRPKEAKPPPQAPAFDDSDFPDLGGCDNNRSAQVKNDNAVKFNLLFPKTTKERPPVQYEDTPQVISDDDDQNEVEADFPSISALYLDPDSKPSSAFNAIRKYHNKNGVTAASALNEVAQQMGWTLRHENASHNSKYKMKIFVTNRSLNKSEIFLGEGEGENKKSATQEASRQSLVDIRRRLLTYSKGGNIDNPPEPKSNEANSSNSAKPGPADAYRTLVHNKLKEIEFAYRNQFAVPRRFAAFIITDTPNQLASDGTLVAFGAGDGRLSDADLKELCNDHGFENLPGYFVRNFDCLVLARRSLQCFFYNQLLMFFDESRQDSQREKNFLAIQKNGFVNLKPGCRLHLYMSHAPYGDCTESIPASFEDPTFLSRQEVERDRKGLMEPLMFMRYDAVQYVKQPGHIRVWSTGSELGAGESRSNSRGNWTSLMDHRGKHHYSGEHLTMSPTDKLTLWIHSGLQGALLSHIMSPIYLYSIQFGRDYMHQHISRALLCRVPLSDLMSNVNDYYRRVEFKDPYIERVYQIEDPLQSSRYVRTQDVSFNWYLNSVSNSAEVIDNKTGYVHQNSPFKLPNSSESFLCSRLSKVCMLIRLRQVIDVAIKYYALKPEFKRARDLQGFCDVSHYDYGRWKASAYNYRTFKHRFFDLLRQTRYGDWQPNENSNRFNLLDHYILPSNKVENHYETNNHHQYDNAISCGFSD